jgi:hypothetical protein
MKAQHFMLKRQQCYGTYFYSVPKLLGRQIKILHLTSSITKREALEDIDLCKGKLGKYLTR